jgi:hypothetical protein
MFPYFNKFLNFVSIEPKNYLSSGWPRQDQVTYIMSYLIRQSMSQILLKHVLYAPAMGLTLVPISKIAKARFTPIFDKNILKIIRPQDSIMGTIDVHNSLYYVDHESCEIATSTTMDMVMIEDLHKRLGHISPRVVKKMV